MAPRDEATGVEAERDQYRRVLEYIASPTMGQPSNVTPGDWALEGASEYVARLALQTCILMATEALARQRRQPPLSRLPGPVDPLALYRLARDVVDAEFGDGTYAKLHRGNPDPAIQAVIAEQSAPKP